MTTAPQRIPIADHRHLRLRSAAWPTSDPARGKAVEEQTPKVALKDITLEYKTGSPLLALDRINLQVKAGEFPLHYAKDRSDDSDDPSDSMACKVKSPLSHLKRSKYGYGPD